MAHGANQMQFGAGTLTRIAGEVSAGRDAFDLLARQLSDKITAAAPQWQGAGGTSFLSLHDAWQTRQKRIVSALGEFEASLHKTESDTTNTDQDQRAAMATSYTALDGIQTY